MSFRARLESKISWLRSIPHIYIVEARLNPPLQETQLMQRQRELGFELDERFLNYFRECNGWSLQWLYSESPPSDPQAELERLIEANEHWKYGRFTVASLLTRAGEHGREPQILDTEHTLRFLGGIEDRHLRQNSYEIQAYGSLPKPNQRMTQYNDIQLYTSAAHPDPICYISTDYYADLSNFRPMRARSFFELGLAFLGNAELLDWFESKGYDGDHELVELEQETLSAALFRCDYDLISERSQPSMYYLRALGRRAKLNRYADSDPTLPELPTVHPYRAIIEGNGKVTTGGLLEALRKLALFEEEQEDPSITGIRLRCDVTGPQLEQCSAYLRAYGYNKPCGPTGYELEALSLCYEEAAQLGDLRATLEALGLKAKAPKVFKGDGADYQEDHANPQELRVQEALEALQALGFTQEELLPVSWSKDYKTLRLRQTSPQAPTPWVDLSFIGPPRQEGEEPFEEAELIYNDDFPAQHISALHELFDQLGLTRRAWRSF